MKSLLLSLVFTILVLPSSGQYAKLSDTDMNEYIKVTARAQITEKGVKGLIRVKNISGKTIFVNGAGASVQVKKATTSSSSWLNQSLKLSSIFLDPGAEVEEDIKGSDSKTSEYVDLRNLKILFGTTSVVSFIPPSEKSFKLNSQGITNLCTVDGVEYKAEVYQTTTEPLLGGPNIPSGAARYWVYLYARNTTSNDVNFSGPVSYKIFWNGEKVTSTGEANFKRIKDGKEEKDKGGWVISTRSPTVYLQFTSIPAITGSSIGNQAGTANSNGKIYTAPVKTSTATQTTTSTQSSAPLTGGSPTPVTTPAAATSGDILFTSDIKVSLTLDGSAIGQVEPGKTLKIAAQQGQHLLTIIPAVDPAREVSEVIEVKAQNQIVKQIKLASQFGELERKRIAAEKAAAQKAEEQRLVEARQREQEEARARKAHQDKEQELNGAFPKTFVKANLRTLQLKAPVAVTVPSVQLLSNGNWKGGPFEFAFFGDSIRTTAGEWYYDKNFYDRVVQQRVASAPPLLTGVWTVFESSREFYELDIRPDGQVRFLSSQKKRVAGVRLPVGSSRYQYRGQWVLAGGQLKMTFGEETLDWRLVDIVAGKLAFEFDNAQVVFNRCRNCSQLALESYSYSGDN